jgi:hypothetical protein
MNCKQFETLVDDLARNDSLADSYRELVLAHAAACPACAECLADQGRLTVCLSELANEGPMEAPPRVEASLIAAFRERAAVRSSESEAMPLAWRRVAYFALAAAASIILALAATRMLDGPGSSPATQDKRAKQAGPPGPASNRSVEVVPAPVGGLPAPPLSTGGPADQAMQVDQPRRMSAGYRPRKTPGGTPPTAAGPELEIATDFFPLTMDSSLLSAEGGQVVRIKLPRFVMASFGLPINVDRAGDSVSADVVVGNDGLARAIRFVR